MRLALRRSAASPRSGVSLMVSSASRSSCGDTREHRLHGAEVAKVVVLFTRRLEDRDLPLDSGMRDDGAEPFDPDPALADVPVAVAVAAQLDLRVVEVEHHDPVEPELALDELEEALDVVLGVDRIPGGPRVRGVEAEAQVRVIDRADDLAELLHRAAAELARARAVLDHQRDAG